jgi:putative hemolysin
MIRAMATTATAPTEAVSAPPARDHIVDVLIAERAPRLTRSLFWPVVRPALYGLLNYGQARRMADAIAPLSGVDGLRYGSELLDLEVEARHLDRIPRTGRCLVVCNHPTGIADGIAIYDALNRVRTDAIFFANADALRVCPRFAEVLIPVEWVEAKRTREKTRATLAAAKAAFEADRAVVMFPAGRLARKENGVLSDPPWAPTAVSLARKYAAPIAPVHMIGPWSTLFHFFNTLSPELRDITLFHELLNKHGKRFELVVGPLIPPQRWEGLDTAEATLVLKAYVERALPASPDQAFA